MKPKQGFLAIVVVFSNVYFSLTVNMSFQLSIYQIIFLNLKNLFITLFVHRQILIHLHHWDHIKENASSNIYSNAHAYYILLNFLNPPCLLRFPFFGTLEQMWNFIRFILIKYTFINSPIFFSYIFFITGYIRATAKIYYFLSIFKFNSIFHRKLS